MMNNQPAFPTGIITDDKGVIVGGSNGMTLRDYFAAKAMQALVSRSDWDTETDFYSKWAYEMADSMLESRK